MTKDFYVSLPKKRMGGGCLFFDEQGRVLLVKPSYKDVWEIPGGAVEENESPRACSEREVEEEIGLKREMGRLLVVDYNAPLGIKTESLMFIFDGGVLSEEELQNIKVDGKEIVRVEFFAQDELPEELTDTLRRRILAAWREKLQNSGNVYLEDQESI